MPNTIVNRRVVFSGGQGSSAPTVSVLQPWYDSLSVKPSAGLWADLQTMADGMNTDGDWGEMDLASVHAAMETDEQRLTPFKSTSGNDFLLIGTPELGTNGFRNGSPGSDNLINLNWNASNDGVKFTLNSAYIGVYGSTLASTQSETDVMGNYDSAAQNYWTKLTITSSTTFIQNRISTSINGDNNTTNTTTGALLNSAKRFYASVRRTSSSNIVKYINGISSASLTNNSISLINDDVILLGSHDFVTPYVNNYAGYTRAIIIGSSLIDSGRVAARLNTFFAARGLTISNY